MSEKIQKVLARSGQGSRREIENIIKNGLVSINGKKVFIGDRINCNKNTKIYINGSIIPIIPIKKLICRVLVYYKKIGEICTRKDHKGRPTVFDNLPKLVNSNWISVGRLDINTSGLLLFTTDGELANRLMHPKYKIEREYSARIYGTLSKHKSNKLISGISLKNDLISFKSIKYQGGKGINKWYRIILQEGKNREIHKLCNAVNLQVNRLIRLRYGIVSLPKKIVSKKIELSCKDIEKLRKQVNL